MELYLVAYDIPSDRRRQRVANWLQDYGQRVQFSVFEVWLPQGERKTFLRRLERLIDAEKDSVRLYYLCGACQKRVITLGQGQPPQPPGPIII